VWIREDSPSSPGEECVWIREDSTSSPGQE
jgi:hypothetical protein